MMLLCRQMRQLLSHIVCIAKSSSSLLRSQTINPTQTHFRTLTTKYTHHRRLNRKQQNEDEDDEESNLNGRANFQLYKSRGQHILTNPRVLDSIVKRAQVLRTDTVLEIGPGTGNLTVRLLESARKVVAVEIDGRMIDVLQKRVEKLGMQDKLTICAGDALKVDLPQFDLCVANIPYGISSPLIAKLLLAPSRPCFRSATLLLQKEFAQRLMAKPGDSEFNRLAVNVGLVATVEHLMNVSKKDFVPSPKVDSSLVWIQHRPKIPAIDLDEWLAFTRTCFSKKNKTLGAIFKQKKMILELFRRTPAKEEDFGSDEDDESEKQNMGDVQEGGEDGLEVGRFKEKIVGILKVGGFDEKRPSKMSHEELVDLLGLFNEEGVSFCQ